MLARGPSLSPRFTLIRPLGRGGMGELWLVHDGELDEPVVAKILPPDAPEAWKTLLRREVAQLRRLSHPAIVRVFDFHQGEGVCFFTMEWVEGETLGAFRGRPTAEVLRLLLPVVGALAHAHERGVVHRDLKAANVVVDSEGRPHLLDFGVSGLLDGVSESESEDLQILGGGTPSIQSPQQRSGEPPHPADDLYALGVLLEELLGDPASRPLPEPLRSLIASLRAPERRDRPPSMAAVKQTLEEVLKEIEGDPRTRVRLIPPPLPDPMPPRVPALVPPTAPPPPRSGAEGGGRGRRGAVALMLVLLLAAAFAVMLELPDWAREHHDASPLPESAARPEPAPMPEALETSARSEPRKRGRDRRGLLEVPPPASRPPQTPPTPAPSRAAPGSPEPRHPPQSPDEEAFVAAMSQGLEALDEEDFATAREAFQKAAALRRGSSEAADGLARAAMGLRLEAIGELRRAAEAGEAEERWRIAAQAYAAVLEIDPAVNFAREGRERSAARADLDERLTFHLAHPERLASPEVLDEAAQLLVKAREIEPAGPRLAHQRERLDQMVEAFSTSVPVILESDAETEVTIYRVGRLGTFTRQTLDLRPGTYTIVGSRQGYRDVRLELVVRPGETPAPLSVRCEEEI